MLFLTFVVCDVLWGCWRDLPKNGACFSSEEKKNSARHYSSKLVRPTPSVRGQLTGCTVSPVK